MKRKIFKLTAVLIAVLMICSCSGQAVDPRSDAQSKEEATEQIEGDDYMKKSNYSYTDIVYRMLDTRYLSYAESGERSYEFTSYDRSSKAVGNNYVSWNANGDGTGYIEKTSDGGFLIAEMEGPGYISRIWSATASSGKVKIYIDGESEPTIDLSFADYFNCTKAPFLYKGLCYNDSARGQNSYVPITYKESCRVVAYDDWGKYYHINYTTFPEGVSVESMPKELSEEQKGALSKVNEFFVSSIGKNPSGVEDAAFEKYTVTKKTPAKKTLSGKGAVSGLLIKLDAKSDKNSIEVIELLKSIKVKIYWDGKQNPSVDVPLGDFFGSAYGITNVKTLLLGIRDDGVFYNYFYMPYLNGARIELCYYGEGSVDISMAVSTTDTDHDENSISYFGSFFTNGKYASAQRHPDHNFLTINGAGRLVGLTLHVSKSTNAVDPKSSPGSPWWGEGDEKFFVDGEKFPSWFGTGTEDFFGYAWCSPVLFNRAFHSQSYCVGGSNSKGNRSLTRLMITDSIPFYDSFDGYLEKYYSDEHVKYGYTSYYYLSDGAEIKGEAVKDEQLTSYFTPDPGALNTNFSEGEYLKYRGSNSSTIAQGPQNLLQFSGRWSENQHLFIRGLTTGQYAEYTLPAETDGKYMIVASLTTAPDYAKIKLSVNGKDMGDEIDCYTSSVAANYLYPIGEAELKAGFSNTVRFNVTGKNASSKNYYIGVDFLILIPINEYTGTENIDLSKYCEVERVNAKSSGKTEYKYEGEDMAFSRYVNGGSTSVQGMAGFGTQWSGAQQLWWRNGTNASTLSFRMFVEASGKYKISGAFTKARDYGKVDVYLNGKRIVTGVDFFNNGVIHSILDLGEHSLDAGYTEIKLVITGKNSAATNYMVGVDYFTIKKAD